MLVRIDRLLRVVLRVNRDLFILSKGGMMAGLLLLLLLRVAGLLLLLKVARLLRMERVLRMTRVLMD